MQEVRGTKDLLPDDFYKLQFVQTIAQKISYCYGFVPVATPIFEFTEVFTKTLGETSDIITKEMYSFYDKNNESITLRPEFTAAIVRMLISKNLQTPTKLFSTGPVFRYERPQKGRQRQFHQINFEFFGESSEFADIEIIALAKQILDKLNIQNFSLEINSLGDTETMNQYKIALVSYLEQYKNELSESSKVRIHTNPLRILDSKDQKDRQILISAPKISSYYTSTADKFFQKVLAGLESLNINYTINENLVRGLDYYNHTVFEFTTNDLGAQNAILAGGRYDQLVESMGGKPTPAIGFAGGIERLMALMDYQHQKELSLMLITMGSKASTLGLKITNDLRIQNINVSWNFSDTIKNGIKKANKNGIDYLLILGENEVQKNNIILKNMNSGEQKELDINNIVDEIKSLIQ